MLNKRGKSKGSDIMANIENLVPFTSDQDREEASKNGKKGGVASGRARREKASILKSLNTILNSDIRITKGALYEKYKAMGIDISDKPLAELMNLGLLYGAIEGNATNYRTAIECNNEIEGDNSNVPTLRIEVSDNSKLEGVLYEANRPSSNDDK